MDGYNPYRTVTPQQRQPQQMGPQQMLQGLNIAKQFGAFGGGGQAAAGAGSGQVAAGAGSGQAAGGAMAGAGPWAALAAIIYANESYASAHGYRDEDPKQYGKDLMSGEVFHQDIEKRFLPNIGIDEGTRESKAVSFLANPLDADPGRSWERLKGIF